MNYIMIAGHLGADPETRFTPSGKKVTTLRVGTRARRNNASNEDETIWWRVTLWGDQFDKMVSFLKKGSAVIIAGDVHKPEIFTDREGKSQISMNITASHLQFSPFGKGERQSAEGGQEMTSAMPASPFNNNSSFTSAPASGVQMGRSTTPASNFDDELPF